MKTSSDISTDGNRGPGAVCESAWPGRCSWVSQPGPGRHPATVRTCKLMNIGSWNVRTLLDLQTPNSRPERRSALVAKELQQCSMGIVASSEMRIVNEDQFAELSDSCSFLWRGRWEEYKRESGVAFPVQTSIVASLEEFPSGLVIEL